MSVTDVFRGGGTDSRLYFAIGGLSLLKALVVRGDKRRFRSELKDAALFLAVGLFLRRAERRRTDKVADIDLIQREVSRRLGGDSSGDGGGIRGRIGGRSGGGSGSQGTRSRSLPERLLG
jgi:hypothetical protein